MIKMQQVHFQPHPADVEALVMTLQRACQCCWDLSALPPQPSLSGNGFPCYLPFLGGRSWTKLLLNNKQLINQ